jgi:hypothetical protein
VPGIGHGGPPSNGQIPMDLAIGHRTGVAVAPLRGGGDHLGQPRETLALGKITMVAPDRGGNAHGGAHPNFPCSLEKRGGGTEHAPTVHRPHHGGVHRSWWRPPPHCCSGPRPGGHRPRGGGATRQAMAVPAQILLLGRGQLVTALGV